MKRVENDKTKLTLQAFVLMIFTSVFGFTNIPRAFYLMGYASIFWYVLAAIVFFIPYALMLGEMGTAFKDEHGGIYSWMSISVNPKFAFVGTFMWYASYVIWMVNVGAGIWIPLSNLIFGVDKTQTWSFFGLSGVQTLGILAVLWILLVTYVSSRGLDKIKRVTSFAGSIVALINVFLFVGGILILFLNKGQFAEPLSLKAFAVSPNPSYKSIISVFSFSVYAIFAYGGLEVVGGLVDQMKDPEKTFPRGIIISALIIAGGYAIGIFIMGIFTNWKFAFTQFSNAQVTLGNVAYIAMNNLGYQLGLALHLSKPVAVEVGNWVSRYMGFSMFFALTGAFFTLIYSPLKQLIEGTPKQIWPKYFNKSENGVPINAMKVQAGIVIAIILFVSFGGSNAEAFFNKVVNMTNISMTLPYMFIAYAFLDFKRNKDIKKPFEIYHSKPFYTAMVWLVIFIVGFANVFTIIQPAFTGQIGDTIGDILMPLAFAGVAWYLYSRYERKYLKTN